MGIFATPKRPAMPMMPMGASKAPAKSTFKNPLKTAKTKLDKFILRVVYFGLILLLGAVFGSTQWFRWDQSLPGEMAVKLSEASYESAPIIDRIAEFVGNVGYFIDEKFQELREYSDSH